MDSGREALLEKAREFGSLAQNMTFQDFLDKSVTYRTLALYLGVETLWWSEFWRSFSFSQEASNNPKLRSFQICCTAKDTLTFMNFLSLWFGEKTRLSDIPQKEFRHVVHLVMKA